MCRPLSTTATNPEFHQPNAENGTKIKAKLNGPSARFWSEQHHNFG
jgi:hypothetical protein